MNGLWDCVIKQCTKMLVQKNKVHANIVVMQLVYLAYFGPLSSAGIMRLVAIVYMIVQRENYFWYAGIVLQGGGWSILNIVMGLLASNTREKLALYLYLVLYFLTFYETKLHYAYNTFALAWYSVQIYMNLPFLQLNDNKYFFCGFIALFVHYGINFFILLANIAVQELIYGQLTLVLIAYLMAYALIDHRIKKLVDLKIKQTSKLSDIFHYVSLLKQKINKSYSGIEEMHRAKCTQTDCFCKEKNQSDFMKLYLRKILVEALDRLKNYEFQEPLYGVLIQQLLNNGKFPLAIQAYLYHDLYQQDIFKIMERQRVKEKLSDKLSFIQSGYCLRTSFQDPFEYEKNFELLRRKILQLIQIKTQFWNQIIKKSTKALKLKTFGQLYLDKLNKMNEFYLSKIVKVQKQLKIFSAGIIYNLFLMSATNYKDLAETNLKTFRKSNDRTEKLLYKLAIIKTSLSKERCSTIQNMNSIALKMIGSNILKSQYLGKDVKEIIPSSYVDEHIKGMNKLREGNDKKLIGAQLETVFIVAANGCIVACSIFMKYSPDIFNELSVIALFKHYKFDHQYILIQDKQPIYSSKPQLDISIVKTKQIESVLKQFDFKWKNVNFQNPSYSVVEDFKVQLKFNDMDYTCTLTSPLCQSFTFPKVPPIHMVIKNENKTYLIANNIIEETDIGVAKKMQALLENNETDSQASGISRRSQIIDILKTFESNSGAKLFCCFYVSIGLIFVIIAGCISIHYQATDIKWIYSNNAHKIKLFDLHCDIFYYITRFMSKGLVLYGLEQNIINNDFQSYQTGKPNYTQKIKNQIISECNYLSLLVYEKDHQNQGMQAQYFQWLNNEQTIKNGNALSVFNFNNLLNFAINNCYQLTYNRSFSLVSIGDIYWKHIYQQYKMFLNYIKTNIESEFHYYEKLNNWLFPIFVVIFILLTIPIYYGNTKIIQQQNYVFDLMISIPTEQIQQDLSNLHDLETSIKQNGSNTFQYEVSYASVQKFEQNEISTNEALKRKRTGQLDNSGNYTTRVFLIILVLLFLSFLVTMFIIRKDFLKTKQQDFNDLSTIYSWRNQRSDLVLNMKKWIFKYHPNELIQNRTLLNWVKTTVEYRRLNFVMSDSIDQVNVSCDIAPIFCKNKTSSQFTINVFFALLVATTLDKEITTYLGPIDILVDLSKAEVTKHLKNKLDKMANSSTTTHSKAQTIYLAFWVTLIISILITIIYLKSVKKQYLYMSRFITLLTQEMSKKNKRVESYLQKLIKNK